MKIFIITLIVFSSISNERIDVKCYGSSRLISKKEYNLIKQTLYDDKKLKKKLVRRILQENANTMVLESDEKNKLEKKENDSNEIIPQVNKIEEDSEKQKEVKDKLEKYDFEHFLTLNPKSDQDNKYIFQKMDHDNIELEKSDFSKKTKDPEELKKEEKIDQNDETSEKTQEVYVAGMEEKKEEENEENENNDNNINEEEINTIGKEQTPELSPKTANKDYHKIDYVCHFMSDSYTKKIKIDMACDSKSFKIKKDPQIVPKENSNLDKYTTELDLLALESDKDRVDKYEDYFEFDGMINFEVDFDECALYLESIFIENVILFISILLVLFY